MSEFDVKIVIITSAKEETIWVAKGENLRRALISHSFTPHKGIWETINCRGNKICGSCEVDIRESNEWNPKRSCQVRCFSELYVRLK